MNNEVPDMQLTYIKCLPSIFILRYSMVWVWLKNGMKLLLCECLYQMQPVSSGVLPGLHFRPWIFLSAGYCSVSTAFTELDIQCQHDWSQEKPHPPN